LKKAQDDRRHQLEAGMPEAAPVSAESGAPPSDEALETAEPQEAPPWPAELLQPAASASGGPLDPALVAYHDKTSVITEQYRSVRTRMLSQNPAHKHTVLAITSSVPGEGKSVTTLNLAFVLAEMQHLNILVVDGDFRRHSLASMLGVAASPGLAEVIRQPADWQQVVQSTPVRNVHFIASGSIGQHNATELLGSKNAVELFTQLQQRYHYVLVDTPPVNTVADVGIIGQMCHAVLLVVRMHATPEPLVKRAARFLQANNIAIAGCILAGHDERSSHYAYRYRYYGYYDTY
jgi:capsular exopolysaccharide synthesis family protein